VTEADRIEVDGAALPEAERPRLWLYHKPAGLVTTTADEKGRRTVFDALPEDMPRVMSVGRLDLNSEGLLLLTNDGGIKRRLELPSTGWVRKYRVRMKGTPAESDFDPLRRGIVADGERFLPMEVQIDRQQGANAWITVSLREGKNREIRRAMAELGFDVNRLIRISYGPFRLGQIKPGEVEEVRPRVLRDQLGLEAATEGHAEPKALKRKKKTGSGGPGKPAAKPRAGAAPGKKPGRSGDGAGAGRGPRPTRSGSARPGDRPSRPTRPGRG
jgi:23S rRNA pseudouridine2605 synthase